MIRLVIAVVIPLAAGEPLRGQDPLVKAATERQERCRSVDVRFTVSEFVVKGSYTALAAETPGPGRATNATIPPNDTTIESDNRLIIDGNRVRFENNHPQWQLPEGSLNRKPLISVANDKLGKVLFTQGIGSGSEVNGIVRPTARSDEVRHYMLVPLLMHFRGADSLLCPYPVESLKSTARRFSIAGKEYQEYLYSASKDMDIEALYSCDTYHLYRLRKLRRGIPSEQYEVAARQDGGELVPFSWARTEYDTHGKVRKVATITISSLVLNAAHQSDEFDLSFPPGCLVHDQRHKPTKEYRVHESGDWHELDISRRETGESVSPPGVPWVQRHFWLLIGSIAALVTISLVVSRRAVLARRAKSS
jgi:hypothetical protein